MIQQGQIQYVFLLEYRFWGDLLVFLRNYLFKFDFLGQI